MQTLRSTWLQITAVEWRFETPRSALSNGRSLDAHCVLRCNLTSYGMAPASCRLVGESSKKGLFWMWLLITNKHVCFRLNMWFDDVLLMDYCFVWQSMARKNTQYMRWSSEKWFQPVSRRSQLPIQSEVGVGYRYGEKTSKQHEQWNDKWFEKTEELERERGKER